MAACPSCRRPVASTRPSCLYCGAALPDTPALVPNSVAAAEAPPTEERFLVIVDVDGADAAAVAAGLGLSRFEASQRLSRGGPDLWRIAPTASAERMAERLRGAGLAPVLISEAEVREGRHPMVAAGGRCTDGALELRVDGGKVRVAASDVLLVVQGPIAREYPPSTEARRVRLATLEGGYRIHLHRRGESRPVELDPDAFDFGPAGVARSSLLTLRDWVQTVAPKAPVDDSFRRIPPALAPSAATDSLGAALAGRSRPAGGKKDALPLDNVDQFRFYSAWRGAVERRCSGGSVAVDR